MQVLVFTVERTVYLTTHNSFSVLLKGIVKGEQKSGCCCSACTGD